MDLADSAAFEAYRSSPPVRVTVPRLLVGALIIVIFWLLTSVAIIVPGMFIFGVDYDTLFSSPLGSLSMLATFSGIWIGAWVAMRYLHREPLSHLFGASRRLSGFWKGFAAVVLTSILSEILIYLLWPEFERGTIAFSTWLLYLIPVALLCFVQTSAEELLFRGYLLRGLANRFRSPWIWGLLPGAAFVSLHLTPGMSGLDVALLVFSIGSLTVALVLLVYLTGNLGAAFGAHMGNNLFAFLLVGHQAEFGTFALFKGAPVEDIGTNAGQVAALTAISVVCVSLTLLLLLHRSSPLRLAGDEASGSMRLADFS
jgi:membrane protease YdiL (CAAX protease family)